MKNDDLSKEQAEDIVKALDKAIQTGPWKQSRLLKAIGQRLVRLRSGFKQKMDEVYGGGQTTTSNLANRIALRQGQHLVYVSLYSADGGNLNTWERIVYNLSSQGITRPIYSGEGEIKAMMRSKVNLKNEAYVTVYVPKDDILTPHPDKVPRDKLGHVLLTLKDRALKLDNLVQFFHESGIYHYQHGRLIRDRDMQIKND